MYSLVISLEPVSVDRLRINTRNNLSDNCRNRIQRSAKALVATLRHVLVDHHCDHLLVGEILNSEVNGVNSWGVDLIFDNILLCEYIFYRAKALSSQE